MKIFHSDVQITHYKYIQYTKHINQTIYIVYI